MQQTRAKQIGYFSGPICFFILLLLPTPVGMEPAAFKVLAVTVLMAIWWITEAIPIPATSLLPIALFPLLGILPTKSATTPYANHLIFLFMGGFFLAVTMERWNLHRRVALVTIKMVGTSPARIVLGFMTATGFLSMWVSNTATAMMMVPIGLAVVTQATGLSAEQLHTPSGATDCLHNFGRSLMLGIAYAASIGGVGTIIGTPPNTVLASQLEELYGVSINFAEWMLFGVPLAALMILVTWWILTKKLFPADDNILSDGNEVIEGELRKLGPIKVQEKWIIAVGSFVALWWIARGLVKMPAFSFLKAVMVPTMADASIGILGAVVLFVIPVNFRKGEFLLDWKTAVKIPWDVILLFGGGLALANAFKITKLANWIALQLSVMQGASIIVFIAVVVLLTIFLTELTSNTATATLLIPIMGSAAVAMSAHPYGPIVAACVASSFAFMLPVATPPNAVVFGSGCMTIGQMARTGFWLNIIGAALITFFVVYYMPVIWAVDLHTVPQWALSR